MKRTEKVLETLVYLLFTHLTQLLARGSYVGVEMALREWLQVQELNFNPDRIRWCYY
jgi:hypothetical protein